jgi:polar amino acid transport system substrate-binding protein
VIDRKPARMPEQKLLLFNSPVRSAVLKGETRLLEKTNAAIAALKKDGTLPAMALKWLKQPLPETF